MISGTDFPVLSKPSYDPECLLSGQESMAGLTYTNSRRDWPSEGTYLDACHRLITPDEILRVAPRTLVRAELNSIHIVEVA